jgi:hypothetical protein
MKSSHFPRKTIFNLSKFTHKQSLIKGHQRSLILLFAFIVGLISNINAQEKKISLPINWKITGWERKEILSLGYGNQNNAAYIYFKAFGYQRNIPGINRLGLGIDLIEGRAGELFYEDVNSVTTSWLPVRVSYTIFGRIKSKDVSYYQILSTTHNGKVTTYEYRDLGRYPSECISPNVVIGASTSLLSQHALNYKGADDYKQKFQYVDMYLEGSLSWMDDAPPITLSFIFKLTIGAILGRLKESDYLSSHDCQNFYIMLGIGFMGFGPRY